MVTMNIGGCVLNYIVLYQKYYEMKGRNLWIFVEKQDLWIFVEKRDRIVMGKRN